MHFVRQLSPGDTPQSSSYPVHTFAHDPPAGWLRRG
jgi:hypothetical protein